ncbi:helix-turn-helix transcriptional regulator [Bradyrhizobium sp. SYSU BS000235]|uniref:helix-turn-helix transcriptional regulator n=1 Tax=Bradyrhizobium sp. SYSU BS000235 TaxID=3411332 RepID=UPI003C70AEC3
MTQTQTTSRQIGELLRQRRERLNPADCGLSVTARRRTPGLRREEVAELAGISVDWYVRLEQGRDSLPSRATVDALAKALRLTPADKIHLNSLAFGPARRKFTKETVPAHLIEMVNGMNVPAYVIGARFDVLCWNRHAVKLFRDYAKLPAKQRNSLYQMFTAPEMRERYPHWEQEARGMLESFRVNYDFWSDAPEFVELVEELKSLSPEFRRWWKEHGIRIRSSGEKVMRHPTFGTIKTTYATFQTNDDPRLTLVIYGQPKGRSTKRRS